VDADNRIIDDIDLRILDILQKNAREAQTRIARSVGLAPSAVLERIRKLETRGVIKGYTAQIDPAALDLGMLAFVAVRSAEPPGDDSVARQLASLPEVLEVHHVAGEDCYLVKIRTRNAEQLGSMLRKGIGQIAGVQSTRTTIVLGTIKETPRIAVPRPADAA
jgi:Lrp/AsnC family leucine-responsive transcriptional regulator